MLKSTIQIVWFKKDLRVDDHLPIHRASNIPYPCLFLWILEPEWLNEPDFDFRHLNFAIQSLLDLQSQLSPHKLWILKGRANDVFEQLINDFEIYCVHSHQETGNERSYKRDQSLKLFFKQKGIRWIEYQNNGIRRGQNNRLHWNESWYNHCNDDIIKTDLNGLHPFLHNLSYSEYILKAEKKIQFQPGGSTAAMRYLQSFLNERCENYLKHISKPALANKSCSRLSPYLAWGNISIKQVYQSSKFIAKEFPTIKKKPLQAFQDRLRWHCHFIQKFETDVTLAYQNMNSGILLQDQEPNEHLLKRWQDGTTGYPLIDASMRCVRATGYLPFRMRAMVVSFLCHFLWQPWQMGSQYLAKQFLDFEPGIHYPQFQMQAGTTGMHTLRIYNPTLQAKTNDPFAVFIKKWVPKLSKVPIPYIFEPLTLPPILAKSIDFTLVRDYYSPITNSKNAYAHAHKKLWEAKNHPNALKEIPNLLLKFTNSK